MHELPVIQKHFSNAMRAVRTQCEVLDVDKYSNPSCGPIGSFWFRTRFFFSLPKHLGCGIFELSRCTTQDKTSKALKEIMFESFEDARQDQLPKHKWQGKTTH